jgi:uncharacterized 2Fe-2S/4Fe-4S cluster protein (DUF4445 family)
MEKNIIIFQPEGKRVEIEKDNSIYDAALKGGIDLVSICNGKGTCGKCKVIVENMESVGPLTEKESEMLSNDEVHNNIRLACLTKVRGDLTVRVPEYSRTGKQRLQIEGIETPINLNPSLRKYYLELKEPSLDDPRSDVDRIKYYLYENFNLSNLTMDYNLLKNLAKILREAEWKFTVVIWQNNIIDIDNNDTTDRIFGYAVDIGTTKLAGYLIDLLNGKVIAAGSLMNPQIPYGEDVVSRLNHPDQKKLQDAVIEGINQILDDLKEKTAVKSEEIYEMTAVGDTIMHHLFFGICPLYNRIL